MLKTFVAFRIVLNFIYLIFPRNCITSCDFEGESILLIFFIGVVFVQYFTFIFGICVWCFAHANICIDFLHVITKAFGYWVRGYTAGWFWMKWRTLMVCWSRAHRGRWSNVTFITGGGVCGDYVTAFGKLNLTKKYVSRL